MAIYGASRTFQVFEPWPTVRYSLYIMTRRYIHIHTKLKRILKPYTFSFVIFHKKNVGNSDLVDLLGINVMRTSLR